MLKLFCYCLLLASVASLNAAEETGHSTDEDDTPKTEEVVVSHHVHGTGAREDLDPTLEALKNMAYLFLPLSLDFVQVKEAHREIVDGVKFELIVETKDNENKPVICQIIVKERPWIAKHDKPRELEYSNCSVSQPADLEAINKKYPDNTIFNIDASYGGDLSHLEGQIMPPRKTTQKPPVQTMEVSEFEFSPLATSLPVPGTTPKENNEIQKLPEEDELSQHAQSALDDLFIYNLPSVIPTLEKDTVNTDTVSEEPYVAVRVTPKVNPIETPAQETEHEDTEGQLIFTNLEVQKQLDALFNIQTSNYDHVEGLSSYNTDDVQEPLVEQVEATTKICPSQIQNFGVYHHAVEHQYPQNNDLYLNNIEFNKRKRQAEEADAILHDIAERVLEQLDHVDSDTYKRILINVLNHRVIKNRYGQIYYISLLYGNTRCNEDSPSTVDCMSSLIESSKKICNVEVEVSVDTGATKLTKSGCAPVGRSKRADHLVGAPVEVTNEDDIESARRLAEESLASYSAAGDGRDYRLVKVSKVTRQVVAGTLYKIDAVVATSADTETDCHLKIWTRPWIAENGNQLTLKCGEEREITHTYSRKKRSERPPGAPEEVTDSKGIAEAKRIAEESLASYSASGDGRTYSLKSITKVTTQVVAGTLYKIDAVVATSGNTEAKCHLEIWDQPWVKENGKQLKLQCDEEQEITHKYSRKRRSERPRGAPEEVTDSKGIAEAKRIAEESLASYSASGDGRTYSLKSITKVTSQVVAGTLYKIDAVVATSGNTEAKCHLEIWDRPWIKENGKQLKLKCDEEQEITHKYSRKRRSERPLGAPEEVTDSKGIANAKRIAEESLASYSAAGDGRTYSLKSITKVTSQVVAGTLYKIDAVVATSGNTEAKCHLEIWDRPWIKENGKQLKLKCDEEQEITHKYSRKRRSERPLGAPEEVTDSKGIANAKRIAEESLASYSAAGDGRTYSLKSITKVTSQVVAGTLYKIDAVVATSGNTEAKCHLEIWDRPWIKENGKQLKLKCDEEQEITHKYSRKRRSERPLGAPEEVTDSKGIANAKRIAEESLASYSAAGDGRTYSLKSITKVTSQVVAGTLYKIDAVVATSGNTEAKCHLEIWDRPWIKENGKQLKLKCDEEQEITHKYSRKRRSERPLGAPEEVTDSKGIANAKRIAEESLASYSAAGDGRTYSLKSITKVTSQVVAGTLYKIDAVVATSGNTEAKCHLEIWDRPWIKENGKQLKLKCDEEQEITHKYSRKRRSERPLGAPEEVTDSKGIANAKRIAEESLASYSAAGDGRTYSLKSITKVTSQVVAGTLYKIDAVVATSGNTEAKCHLEIWDRPWIKENGKQLKLKCDEEQEITHKYSRKRRSERPLGAPEEVTDSKGIANAKRIAEESLASYSAAGDGRTYSLKSITKVTSQVVAGTLYKIDAVVATSGNTEAKCHLEIWDRPWIKENGKQLKLKCDEEQEITHKYSRKRRSEESVNGNVIRRKRMRGSPEQVTDENELNEIKNLAEKSLKSYTEAGDGQTFKLKNIWDVSSQVVAGFLYKMKSTVETNDGEVECDLEIWTREWIKHNGNQITIKCNNQEPIVHRYRRSTKDVSSINGKKPLRKNSYHLFNKFLYKYKKTYPTRREEKLRYKIFRKNLHLIDQLNALEQGTAVYGITEFADMTPDEYQSRTGLVPRSDDANHIRNPIAEIPDIELPKEFDWRKKNVISEVKNQGSCGSCWAFSVTGNIEGLHAIRTGKLEEYSEQELLDCDTVDNACNGGLPDDAYKAIEKLGGLELESEYPYEARKDQCKFNSTLVHVRVKGAVDLPPDETAMAKWLVANGPISIGINANAMQFYRGGISHPWRLLCRKGGIDHGVLIVGYGVADYPVFNKTIPYWIVKNSWGPSWGEQGYYRVYRGDNTCGINSMASSAVLAD